MLIKIRKGWREGKERSRVGRSMGVAIPKASWRAQATPADQKQGAVARR